MTYGFKLEWSDLPEELQAEKIDEQIQYNYQNGEYDEGADLDDLLEDEAERSRTENYIGAHFPIYF